MPKNEANSIYAENVEYFHPSAFSADGAWSSTITTAVKNFYNKVFGSGATNVNSMYNLYGAIMTSGEYKGKFHEGVDIYSSNGSTIKSAHAGTATVGTTAGGQVAFNGLSPNRIYLHLSTSVTNPVIVGAKIGTQQAPYGHLHFEVNTKGTAQIPVPDSNTSMKSMKPYDYM